MDNIKCKACGLLNLPTETDCFRCGSPLARGQETAGKSSQTTSESSTRPTELLDAEEPPSPALAKTLNMFDDLKSYPCPSCGKPCDYSARLCVNCGRDLTKTPDSLGFYRSRLVPDSDFKRQQPEAVSAATPQRPDSFVLKNSKVNLFAILNFVLALLPFVWSVLIIFVMVYGVFFSGDAAKEVAAGVAGSSILLLPALISLAVYLIAGVGLLKRRIWGYYFHIAAAIISAFSCFGIIYTAFALYFAFQPDFKQDFSKRGS